MPPTFISPSDSTWSVVTSGQQQIPGGVYGWSINVLSGAAFVNGQGPISAPYFDQSFNRTTQQINVGCTGGKTVLRWETLTLPAV